MLILFNIIFFVCSRVLRIFFYTLKFYIKLSIFEDWFGWYYPILKLLGPFFNLVYYLYVLRQKLMISMRKAKSYSTPGLF
jgi:hypothetical protein